MMYKIISFQNPVFCGYLTYCAVLVLKMMLMTPLTIRQRFKRSVLASPEDLKYYDPKKVIKSHEDIERVRRAHLNDLENILIYFLVAFTYLLTNPTPAIALNLFRIYTVARFIHTFVYGVVVVAQPARGLSWLIGYLITGYMAVHTICHFQTF